MIDYISSSGIVIFLLFPIMYIIFKNNTSALFMCLCGAFSTSTIAFIINSLIIYTGIYRSSVINSDSNHLYLWNILTLPWIFLWLILLIFFIRKQRKLFFEIEEEIKKLPLDIQASIDENHCIKEKEKILRAYLTDKKIQHKGLPLNEFVKTKRI